MKVISKEYRSIPISSFDSELGGGGREIKYRDTKNQYPGRRKWRRDTEEAEKWQIVRVTISDTSLGKKRERRIER